MYGLKPAIAGFETNLTQKMPFSTRLSSTRGMPRGLLGSGGSITRQSKSVRSYRLMPMLNQMCTQRESRQSVTAQLQSFRDCRCSPASGRWKFRIDPWQTARSVEHVMAVRD
jgi:hypothetical protein